MSEHTLELSPLGWDALIAVLRYVVTHGRATTSARDIASVMLSLMEPETKEDGLAASERCHRAYKALQDAPLRGTRLPPVSEKWKEPQP